MIVQIPPLPPLETITQTNFVCKRCGKCCQKREAQIVLNPMDVLVISEYLGISKEKFILTKTTKSIGRGLPEITLKTYGKKQECCFFDSRKGCEIHEVSPFQCYTFPIIPYDEERELYVKQPVHSYCGQEGEMKSIKEWLNESSRRYKNEQEVMKLWLISLPKIDKFCNMMSTEEKEEAFAELFLKLEDVTVEALEKRITNVFCNMY